MMVTATELSDYRIEIREQVCSRCVERPPDGPPCEPRGKYCGVELHLPELIDSIHGVHGDYLGPYLEHNREHICANCEFLNSDICPCPMDYLLCLIVQAVETVDKRRGITRRETKLSSFEVDNPPELEEIWQAYVKGRGRWMGCDWSTRFGKAELDLKDITSAQAQAFFEISTTTDDGESWAAAARWLKQIEKYARLANEHARLAVSKAEAGEWEEAMAQIERAWALEFASGRVVWRPGNPAWKPLREVIERAFAAQKRNADVPETSP